MTSNQDQADIGQTLDIFDGVVYGDLFDCAMEAEEVVRFSRQPTSEAQVMTASESMRVRSVIGRKGDYFFLKGRDDLVARREETRARARRLRRRAERVTRWIQMVPFVRGVLLTGSVAAEAAPEDADIDLMIIVAPSRLALVFLLLGGFSSLTRRRLYCSNYYLSEDQLVIDRRNLFIAHEIAQARPLSGIADRFFEANEWIRDFLPNYEPRPSQSDSRRSRGRFQAMLELPFRGRFGKWTESMASRVVRKRLDAHYRGGRSDQKKLVVEQFQSGRELRFHNQPVLRGLKERHAEHRSTLESAILQRCDGSGTA